MNKSQKRLRSILHKEKANIITVTIPTHGYHNNPKGIWTTRTVGKGKVPSRGQRAKVAAKSNNTNKGPSIAEQLKMLPRY
jgi:hypothetical protein